MAAGTRRRSNPIRRTLKQFSFNALCCQNIAILFRVLEVPASPVNRLRASLRNDSIVGYLTSPSMIQSSDWISRVWIARELSHLALQFDPTRHSVRQAHMEFGNTAIVSLPRSQEAIANSLLNDVLVAIRVSDKDMARGGNNCALSVLDISTLLKLLLHQPELDLKLPKRPSSKMEIRPWSSVEAAYEVQHLLPTRDAYHSFLETAQQTSKLYGELQDSNLWKHPLCLLRNIQDARIFFWRTIHGSKLCLITIRRQEGQQV